MSDQIETETVETVAPVVVDEPAQVVEEKDWKAEYEKTQAEARKWEARSKENKTAADELAAIRESQKTESQKQQEEREALLKENADLKALKLRTDVATEKGVPVALLSGSTKEELEAAADLLIEFRGVAEQKKLVISGEGKSPTKVTSDEQSFVRDLFGNK
jgi:hypothetical protein